LNFVLVVNLIKAFPCSDDEVFDLELKGKLILFTLEGDQLIVALQWFLCNFDQEIDVKNFQPAFLAK
jgi:hypothetical protein